MQLQTPLSLLLLIVACQGHTLWRLAAQQGQSVEERTVERAALAAEQAALLETEKDDQHFWNASLAAQEAELKQLEAAAMAAKASGMDLMQPKATGDNQTHENHTANQTTERRVSPLAGIKLNLNPKSTADLIPALAMLKSLYEDGKTRIAKLNEREKLSKQRYTEKEAEHKARLARVESRFANHTLSLEFRTNETKDENRLWTYWDRVRERQHRQYHTSLKIQHGTMDKVKHMIDMYEKTISGKADAKTIKGELAIAGGMPEIVFLQQSWQAIGSYCHDALAEVHEAAVDLQGSGMDADRSPTSPTKLQ